MKEEKRVELLFFFKGLVKHYKETHEIGPGFDEETKLIFRVLDATTNVDKTRALGGLTWLENTARKWTFIPSWFRIAIPSIRILLKSLPDEEGGKND